MIKTLTKKCLQCNETFKRKKRFSFKWWKTAKYCSVNCSAQSKVGKPGGMRGKISPNKGKKMSEEQKKKLSLAHLGKSAWNKGIKGVYNRSEQGKISFREKMSGPNNPKWVIERGRLIKGDRILNDPLQQWWSRSIKNRDNWKCRISNENCSGKLEAHHILPWSEFPELRYQLNNGITLCHAHHPRKRDEVAKLSPYFQMLVA